MNKKIMFESYNKMGKNFMTPKVLNFQAVGNRIVELSSGFGIDNSPIWGVSEFIYTNRTKTGLESSNRSKMFTKPKEARAYYKTLTKAI